MTAGAEEVPDKDPYWSDPAEGERLTWRVQIKIHEVLPCPIPCAELAADPAWPLTLTDGRSQVRHAAALAVGTVTWLRDEEALRLFGPDVVQESRSLAICAGSTVDGQPPPEP